MAERQATLAALISSSMFFITEYDAPVSSTGGYGGRPASVTFVLLPLLLRVKTIGNSRKNLSLFSPANFFVRLKSVNRKSETDNGR
jgi:hypothetical protein